MKYLPLIMLLTCCDSQLYNVDRVTPGEYSGEENIGAQELKHLPPQGLFLENQFDVLVTYGIQFGTAIDSQDQQADLLMDIYEPDDPDHTNRPVVIAVHGGGFTRGTRYGERVFANNMAQKGYVVASIDYRLAPSEEEVQLNSKSAAELETHVRAIQDLRAAIRHMRMEAHDTNPYEINPDMIFASGSSAGAYTVLTSAYVEESQFTDPNHIQVLNELGGFEGQVELPAGPSNLRYSSSVLGVSAFAGNAFINEATNTNAPPLISIHGLNDNIVPIEFTYELHNSLEDVQVRNELFELQDAGHIMSNVSATQYPFIEQFFYEQIVEIY